MKWLIYAIAVGSGACAGIAGGYYAGAYAGCIWFWPNSNLCGIVGVPAAFAGASLGTWIGLLIARACLRR